jgi:hypothetical protein
MTEDVPCDFCQSSHEESILLPDRKLNSEKHTGISVIQREKLRAYNELIRYREHLDTVRSIYLLCRSRDES